MSNALCSEAKKTYNEACTLEDSKFMSVIVKDPEVLGGEPVFRGTRVPFQTLLDYLEHGKTLYQFLDEFPTVTREAAIAGLEEAKAFTFAGLK
jgi:uncharacterized protein (DUF433 family)